jgi:hypothetical protein
MGDSQIRRRSDNAFQSLLNDPSNPFDMRKTYFGPTRKFDQITPHSFGMRKALTKPLLVTGKKMNGNIASLHFVAGAVKRFYEARG